MKRPCAREFDALCAQYEAFDQQIENIKELQKPLREKIMAAVLEHGDLHAEKSRILQGSEFEALRSQGQSATVDQMAVAKLYAALAKRRCHAFFTKLFRTAVKYELQPNFNAVLEGPLPPSAPPSLRALARAAVDIEPSAPRLNVRRRQEAK